MIEKPAASPSRKTATAARRGRSPVPACVAAILLLGFAWTIRPALAEPPPTRLTFASTFPGDMKLIGTGAQELADRISRATAGQLLLEFHEPGSLVPAAETLEAVSSGAIDAGWGGAGWFNTVDSAFNMFSAMPFGPGMGEYLAWMYHGGGLDMAREMFARHNIHNIPCAVIPPEASGWFRKEIATIQDLRGLRMRFFGLGAKVMERLGVTTLQLPPGDVLAALQRDEIDAAEFSLPQMDQDLGFQGTARYYYFPGWHQQATFFDLYINSAVWAALPDPQKAIVELACGDMIRHTIAAGEAAQWRAMREMQAAGVQIRRWPPEIIAAMESAWNEVAEEEARRNPTFRRVYDSYMAFRRDYAIWHDHAYLK
ncbi:TRAP transporter substrate-binding protein [Marinibaculum pumilum]|uniref:TRAP transporter substrate-binding protein n=1 Tax=Marinibaculum pumilum TaxID=1766165 RepID=A0ABV7L2Q7_9PROT